MTTRHTIIYAMVTLLTAAIAGCGSGPYSYARYYEPLEAERPYHETSREFTLGAVTARPQDFDGQLIAWFGIVEKVLDTKDGRSLVRLSFHKHKNRHLCEGETESTCRVTVNQGSTGKFAAAVFLKPEDMKPGLDKIQPGTLMRIIGKVRCVEDENGDPKCDTDAKNGIIIYCDYYRQWPARHYRTTRSAGKMVR